MHIVEAKLIKTVANEEWFIKHISTKNKLSKNKLHTSSTGNNATLVPMSKITKTDFASENGPSENCICRYVLRLKFTQLSCLKLVEFWNGILHFSFSDFFSRKLHRNDQSSFLPLSVAVRHTARCRYSTRNTRKTLIRFCTVPMSTALASSDSLCHTSGNGLGITCRIRTCRCRNGMWSSSM